MQDASFSFGKNECFSSIKRKATPQMWAEMTSCQAIQHNEKSSSKRQRCEWYFKVRWSVRCLAAAKHRGSKGRFPQFHSTISMMSNRTSKPPANEADQWASGAKNYAKAVQVKHSPLSATLAPRTGRVVHPTQTHTHFTTASEAVTAVPRVSPLLAPCYQATIADVNATTHTTLTLQHLLAARTTGLGVIELTAQPVGKRLAGYHVHPIAVEIAISEGTFVPFALATQLKRLSNARRMWRNGQQTNENRDCVFWFG